MIRNQRASSYAELNSFINNHKASIGRHLVEVDETRNGVPSEYFVDSDKNLSLVNETTLFNGDIF